MRLKILLFIFSFIILAGTSLNAQNIAIHTDKDIYFPGETVWFKGYVVENEKPAIHYTNFYIGLYNEKGKQIASKHYPLFDGTCTGNFTIPDSVNSSVIQLYGFIGNTTSPAGLLEIQLHQFSPQNTLEYIIRKIRFINLKRMTEEMQDLITGLEEVP